MQFNNQGSLNLKYEFLGGQLDGFSIGGGLFFSGKRYGDLDSSFYDPSYTRFDAQASYRMQLSNSKVLTASLNVNNITDTKYYILRARWSNIPASSRAVFGSIRLDF